MSELTRGRSGRWLLVVVAVGLLVALAIAVPPTRAAHEAPVDAGVILLSTGPDSGDNWIRYYTEDQLANFDVDTFEMSQPLSTRRCGVTSNDSIFELSQSGGSRGIGLVSNGLGARDKNNCSTDGGNIGPGESLTFTLALGDDYGISSAEVDVEGKHNSKLGYSLDGGAVQEADLDDSSDNGPDAGPADNNIVTIDGEFQEITFTATSSSKATVSIEGGGDGDIEGSELRDILGVEQSLFRVFKANNYDLDDLECGDVEGPSAPVDEDGPATTILLSRADNLKDQPCAEVAYSFRIEEDSVFFDADLDGQENARFLVRIEWDPADPIVDPLNPPDRDVNFFPENLPDAYYPIDLCVSLISEGATNDINPDINDTYEHPDGEVGTPFAEETVPWCLAGEQLVLLDTGKWQQIQWYDGAGDPHWR